MGVTRSASKRLPRLAGPTTTAGSTAATTAWRRSMLQVSHAARSAASVVRCFRAAAVGGRLVDAGDERLAADALNVADSRLARCPAAGDATSQQERPPAPEPAPTRAVREDPPDRLPRAAIKDRRPR